MSQQHYEIMVDDEEHGAVPGETFTDRTSYSLLPPLDANLNGRPSY